MLNPTTRNEFDATLRVSRRSLLGLAAVAVARPGPVAVDLPVSDWPEFEFCRGDYSAQVAADRVGGIYRRNPGTPPTVGAWVRVFSGPAQVAWFSANGGLHGHADDTAAVLSISALIQGGWLKALRWDQRLRFTDVSGRLPGAVTLLDVSDVVIDMTGGELIMDNLRPDGAGAGSGFWWGGACHGCVLRNPTIRWARRPRLRSRGDGITVKSRPGEGSASRNFRVEGTAKVRWSPQAGIILLGCDRPFVARAEFDRTLADGLHFNACRAPQFGEVVHQGEPGPDGDDAVALVTYHDPAGADGVTRAGPDWRLSAAPWAQPTLGEWSNGGARGGSVRASAGRANAVRIAGALDVRIERIAASGKQEGAGLSIDSAQRLGPAARWRYQASRGVQIGTLDADGCDAAVQVVSRGADHPAFTSFDVVIESVRSRGALRHAVEIERAGGVRLRLLEAEGTRLQALRLSSASHVHVESITARSSAPSPALVIAAGSRDVTVGKAELSGTDVLVEGGEEAVARVALDEVTCRNLLIRSAVQDVRLGSIRCADGFVFFEGDPTNGGRSLIRNVAFELLASTDSPAYGIYVADIEGLTGGRIEVARPLRDRDSGERRAVVLERVRGARFNYDLRSDDANIVELSVGGGNASRVSADIVVGGGTWRTPKTRPDVLVQQGAHAPRRLTLRVVHAGASGKHPVLR